MRDQVALAVLAEHAPLRAAQAPQRDRQRDRREQRHDRDRAGGDRDHLGCRDLRGQHRREPYLLGDGGATARTRRSVWKLLPLSVSPGTGSTSAVIVSTW